MLTIYLPASIAEPPSSNAKADHEALYWQTVKESNNIDMYRAYIKRYPNGAFVDLAQIKISELERAATVPPLNDLNERVEKNAPPAAKTETESISAIDLIRLRNSSQKLEDPEIIKMVSRYNFADQNRNPNGAFQNAFVDNNNGTIIDLKTNLIWEKTPTWTRRVEQRYVQRYIDGLNYEKLGGCSNWRLPTIEELASLLESKYTDRDWLFIDPMFANAAGWLDRCWTVDTCQGSLDNYGSWIVDFYKGTIAKAYSKAPGATLGGRALQNEQNYIRAVCSKN
jgi:hypothetical protein